MTSPTLRPARFVVALLVTAALIVIVAWPQAYGIQTAPIVAQLIAFRAVLAVGLGVVAVVSAVVAVWKRTWGIAAAIAFAVGLAAIVNVGVLLARGAGHGSPGGELTVAAWNTQGGAASADAIARLVLETDADVVSLPETSEDAAAEAVRILRDEGYGMIADTTYGASDAMQLPTSLLIADHLGEYEVDASAGSTPGMPSAVWRPVGGSGPTVIAAHPFPPIPGRMGAWRGGLAWIADQCDSPEVIVAGDLNATLDHLAGLGRDGGLVGQCRDTGAAGVGTWPADVPAWLASPIDHVLVGPAWTVVGSRVLTAYDDAGSDHRPVVALLARTP